MYTKEQMETALKEFERLGSVQATITLLGYPSNSTLYKWYERKLNNKQNYHGSLEKPYNVEYRYINSASDKTGTEIKKQPCRQKHFSRRGCFQLLYLKLRYEIIKCNIPNDL